MNPAGSSRWRRVRCILDYQTPYKLILLKVSLMDDYVLRKLTALKKSKFRSKFRLTSKERTYTAQKDLETIRQHAYQFVQARIAMDYPNNDEKQTPMQGHPVFIAQHATATCCRGCIQKWHGFEKGRALNGDEVDFIVALIMGWIELQLDENDPDH